MNTSLLGGPCYGWVLIQDPPWDGFTEDERQSLYPDGYHYGIGEVPCNDGGGFGNSGAGTPGQGGGGGFGMGGSTGLPPGPTGPLPDPCLTNYGIPVDSDSCANCCNRIAIALNKLMGDFNPNLPDGFTDRARKLFDMRYCNGVYNSYFAKLMHCLFNETYCVGGQVTMTGMVRQIKCDTNIIKKCAPKGARIFWNAYPGNFNNDPNCPLEGNTIYVDCTYLLSLKDPLDWRTIIESFFFHEFVHVCEQCIFDFWTYPKFIDS